MATVVLLGILVILMQSPVLSLRCIREPISPNEVNEGFINSPGYPREYPSSVCHIWYHMVSRETKVSIEIRDLDIPSMDNCQSNNSNRLLIGPQNQRQYCGSLRSDLSYTAVISSYFYIVFIIHETYTSSGRGFLLHYKLSTPDDLPEIPTPKRPIATTTPPRNIDDIGDARDQPCVMTTTDAHGIITIPKMVISKEQGYDVERKMCSWLLQTPTTYTRSKSTTPIYRYALRFDHFHFFPDCCALDIFVGSSARDGQLVGHYFSASHPHLLYALGPQVYIRLTFRNYRYFGNFTIQYQREEICLSGYKACSYNESGCYPASKRCDGVWDCPMMGGDERGCSTSCSEHKFSCGNTSAYCFFEKDRCNGKGACANYRDEQDCSPSQCSSEKGLFLCKNRRCIYEKWRCDHTQDCEDGSDEEDCSRLSSPRLIIACVVGTLISSLLLVLALSFAMRVYALRMRRRHGGELPARHESPLSRIEQDLLRRRAPPPQYNEAMMTSRSYDEAYLELLSQGQSNHATEISSPQEGVNNSNTSGSTTGTRRDRSRRSGNRRRGGRDRRHHRNLRLQNQQHLQGCPALPPPPPPLHYFTEQPPSYTDSTSGVVADMSAPISSENQTSCAGSDFSSADGRNHELQTLSNVVSLLPSSSSTSSTTTSSEPDPPPYSLHNDFQSDSSRSDDDDDDDDDDMIDDVNDNYTNSNFSSFSSSRRVSGNNNNNNDDDDDDCLLLRGEHSEDEDEEDDDEEEEDDTCLSVIPESTHSHLMTFAVPPLAPNSTISPDLMTATELEQMSSNIIKEDDGEIENNGRVHDGDKKDEEEEVVAGSKDSPEDSGSEPSPLRLTPEESGHSQNVNIAHCSLKVSSSQVGNGDGVSHVIDENDDDDDDECILNGGGFVAEEDYSYSDETTSDTTCLLGS